MVIQYTGELIYSTTAEGAGDSWGYQTHVIYCKIKLKFLNTIIRQKYK